MERVRAELDHGEVEMFKCLGPRGIVGFIVIGESGSGKTTLAKVILCFRVTPR